MGVVFQPPFAEKSEFTLTLPDKFKDIDGRPLANAALFPLKAQMAAYPPLAKFAAAPFGILELNADATLPLSLRNVEVNLPANRASPGTVASLKVEGDAAIIDWIAKVENYHENSLELNGRMTQTRELSLLNRALGVKKLELPPFAAAKDGLRPFEVVGIPLPAPGFYVLELESQRLGAALLGQAGADVRAHQRAGDQSGGARQARARQWRGLGDHAGRRQTGGGRRRAHLGLPRQGIVARQDRRQRRGDGAAGAGQCLFPQGRRRCGPHRRPVRLGPQDRRPGTRRHGVCLDFVEPRHRSLPLQPADRPGAPGERTRAYRVRPQLAARRRNGVDEAL